jgi:WD40 repeat protein
MKKKSAWLLVLVFVLCFCGLATFGIWLSQYQRIKPIKAAALMESFPFSENFSPISVDQLKSIEERFLLSVSSIDDPILAVSQRMNGNILTIDSEGWLTEWCWEEGTGWRVCQQSDMKYARSGWVNFSDDGSFVVLPKGYDGEDVSGYAIWSTQYNEIVREDPDTQFDWYYTSGFYLSQNGNIIVDYGAGTLFYVSNWADRISYADDLFNFVKEEYPVIGRVVIDPDEEFLAIAFEKGQISIGDIEEGNYLGNSRQYYLLEEGETTEIKDLQFNSTRTCLAWLSGERLVVIRLQNMLFKISLDVTIDDGRLLAFDRTGRILVVATGDSLLFFDVKKNKQIAEYSVDIEITSLFFSQDNRLLIWGDAEGNVHLWGVPVD